MKWLLLIFVRLGTEEELSAMAEECSWGQKRTIGGFKVLDYDDMLKIYHIAK